MDVACAVRRHVIAEGVEILAATFGEAFHRALKGGKNLEEFARGLNRRIDESFRAQIEAVRFLQESKWEARNDAKGILAVNAPSGKRYGNGLFYMPALRQIRKIHGRFKQRGGRRVFFGHSFYAQRKGRQG